MTKVQALFRSAQPLRAHQLARLAELHSVYGIARVRAALGNQEIEVEYDGTRLAPPQVKALVEAAGLPVTN